MATRIKSRPAPISTVVQEVSTTPEPVSRPKRGPAVNRVVLLGRLTADPEMRYTPGGHSVATLRLATNEREEPEFHDVVVWRHLAEAAAQYLSKGRLLYVEGRLHGRTWQAQDGTSRRTVEVIAETLQMLDRPVAES